MSNATRPRRTTPRVVVEPYRTLRRRVRQDAEDAANDNVATHAERPRTRAECADGPRPCPWLSCRHHLGLDVKPNGAIRITHPNREPWALTDTCSLDVAERGPHTLESIGQHTNLTRERARQVIIDALGSLARPLANDGPPLPRARPRGGR